MPIAVVSFDEVERCDLKTCPPDGYVLARGLSHGEKMQRRELNNKMTMRARKGQKDVDTIVEMFNANAELYDFSHCVVEHNLTDKDGRPLDFKNPKDVGSLKGPIAEEISAFLDKLNNFEDDEELGK